MHKFRSLVKNQSGMSTFMVTTVLILVIGLLLTGFSQTVRRNQRETLDRQLSTQAFYAAESGVNYAAAVARNAVASGGNADNQNDCGGSVYPKVELDTGNIETTCILVDASLDSLYYSSVTEQEGTVALVKSADGVTNIDSITITWYSKLNIPDPTSGCVAGSSLPPKGSWSCGFGMLRTDLAPLATGGTAPTDIAMSNFFKPQVGGALPLVGYSAGGGRLSNASCTDTAGCSVRITLPVPGNTYYLRLRSIYQDSAVKITAQSGGSDIELAGQATIDVTARAQDVLRRIQVRVPLYDFSDRVPVFALESNEALCKRFSVAPPDIYVEDSPVSGCTTP